MTRITVKDLDVELTSLKEDFQELSTKYDTLFKKYEDHEKICEKGKYLNVKHVTISLEVKKS